MFIKTFAEDLGFRFETSNYELEKPSPKEINKKVIGFMKTELGLKTMTKFVGLRAKTYSYSIDDSSEGKKAKRAKSVPQKENLKLKIIKTVQNQLNLIITFKKTLAQISLKKIIKNL